MSAEAKYLSRFVHFQHWRLPDDRIPANDSSLRAKGPDRVWPDAASVGLPRVNRGTPPMAVSDGEMPWRWPQRHRCVTNRDELLEPVSA